MTLNDTAGSTAGKDHAARQGGSRQQSPKQLQKQTPKVDIDERFRKELREQQLPDEIALQGNQMLVDVATHLLRAHARHIRITERGAPVALMSMEAFGARFLGSFLEEQDPPHAPRLLHTIPEEEIVKYAKRHGIAVVPEEHDEVREMLDRIAKRQPQTYFSLAKSGERLSAAAEQLRKGKRK
jgi:hypothetical protein